MTLIAFFGLKEGCKVLHITIVLDKYDGHDGHQ